MERKHVLAAACVSAIMLAAAAPASAKVRNVWPYQLQPHRQGNISSNEDWSRNGFYYVTGEPGAEAYFIAPLKLKPGSRITKLSVSARCLSPGTMRAYIRRKKMDTDVETLATINQTNTSYPMTWFQDDTIESPMVEPGYLYWVEVYAQDARAYVYGLKVFYR